MADFELEYVEDEPIELEFVEAVIKPEITAHVTPEYEAQTIHPPAGTVFGDIEVDPIPDPTDIKEIIDNGDYDVRRYGTARVNVQPPLQDKEVTPSEEEQTVTPNVDKYGLSSVKVNPIPSQYIVPTGKITLTQNETSVNVSQYAEADIAVPIPPAPVYQSKTVTPTESQQTVEPDGGKDALSSVVVERIPTQYIVPAGTKQISQNGTGIDVASYAAVDVAVPVPPQPTGTAQISTNGIHDVAQYASAEVNVPTVISSNYFTIKTERFTYTDDTWSGNYTGLMATKLFNLIKIPEKRRVVIHYHVLNNPDNVANLYEEGVSGYEQGGWVCIAVKRDNGAITRSNQNSSAGQSGTLLNGAIIDITYCETPNVVP